MVIWRTECAMRCIYTSSANPETPAIKLHNLLCELIEIDAAVRSYDSAMHDLGRDLYRCGSKTTGYVQLAKDAAQDRLEELRKERSDKLQEIADLLGVPADPE